MACLGIGAHCYGPDTQFWLEATTATVGPLAAFRCFAAGVGWRGMVWLDGNGLCWGHSGKLVRCSCPGISWYCLAKANQPAASQPANQPDSSLVS